MQRNLGVRLEETLIGSYIEAALLGLATTLVRFLVWQYRIVANCAFFVGASAAPWRLSATTDQLLSMITIAIVWGRRAKPV